MRTVSNRYARIESADICSTIELSLDGLSCNYERKAIKGMRATPKSTKHGFMYTLTSEKMLVNNDVIIPTIHVFNSYDGSSALKLAIGCYRLVCSNGLVVGKDFYAERVVHVKGARVEEFMSMLYNKIVQAVQLIRSELGSTLAKLQVPVTFAQQLAVVESLPLSQRVRERIVGKLTGRVGLRVEDQGSTVWTLWNIINEELRQSARSELRLAERNIDLLPAIQLLAA